MRKINWLTRPSINLRYAKSYRQNWIRESKRAKKTMMTDKPDMTKSGTWRQDRLQSRRQQSDGKSG